MLSHSNLKRLCRSPPERWVQVNNLMPGTLTVTRQPSKILRFKLSPKRMDNINRREQIKAQRAALSQTELQSAAQRIYQQVRELPAYQAAQQVAFYQAVRGEISPQVLLQFALSQGKQCYLPVVQSAMRQLFFSRFQAGDVLQKNEFGILEPIAAAHTIIPNDELDVVLMPLVACDRQGNRLGMGAGFYDRTFDFLNGQSRPSKPILIGLAHEFQVVDDLTAAAWDVTLDIIVTPKDIFPVSVRV